MLCLGRYRGERIVLMKDEKILASVKVHDVRNRKVRLVFDADNEIVIVREELVDEKKLKDWDERNSTLMQTEQQ